jgi:hypothetical protein
MSKIEQRILAMKVGEDLPIDLSMGSKEEWEAAVHKIQEGFMTRPNSIWYAFEEDSVSCFYNEEDMGNCDEHGEEHGETFCEFGVLKCVKCKCVHPKEYHRRFLPLHIGYLGNGEFDYLESEAEALKMEALEERIEALGKKIHSKLILEALKARIEALEILLKK